VGEGVEVLVGEPEMGVKVLVGVKVTAAVEVGEKKGVLVGVKVTAAVEVGVKIVVSVGEAVEVEVGLPKGQISP
jgi:hypothetical protein